MTNSKVTELCNGCQTIAQELSTLISRGHTHPLPKNAIRHAVKFGSLSTTRATCRLCQLLFVHNPIARRGGEASETTNSPEVSMEDYAIVISPIWVTDDRPDEQYLSISSSEPPKRLKWLHVSVTQASASQETSRWNEKDFPVVLSIFGIRDSLPVTAGFLWNRYRFPNSGSEDALSLLRRWMKNCLYGHPKCNLDVLANKRTREGQRPLPTRVLDVGPLDSSCRPRLLVTNGKRGSWVALSHCWGNVALHPPRTTKQNLEERRARISLDELPQLFQDAVMVTRALNIRYLWIDSLCIIQDDLNDWRRECEVMGLVYRDSIVTVAAGDATNCNQSLFSNTKTLSYSQLKGVRDMSSLEKVSKAFDWDAAAEQWDGLIGEGIPAVTEAVEMPYDVDGGVGSFHISPKDDDVTRLINCPLFDRAWVTQEWVLSRRTILFLKDAVIWACSELQEDERGSSHRVERSTSFDWQSLVEAYTKKQLTHESDRLAAIRGLANHRQELNPDVYFAGTWEGDLPEALLWINPVRFAISEEFSHLPSWTWARVLGPVMFKFKPHSYEGVDKPRFTTMCKITDTIGHSGSLQIDGPVKQIERMVDFAYDSVRHVNTDGRDMRFMKHCFRGRSSAPSFFFKSSYRQGLSIILKACYTRVGWAAWDLGQAPHGPIYCLGLVLERSCINPRSEVSESITDAYHVLFLQKEPLSSTRFVRVGIGVILRDDWFDSALPCRFNLV